MAMKVNHNILHPFLSISTATSLSLSYTHFIRTVPRERWIPEHSMQSVMPRLMEAQRGSGKPQSQHLSLPGIDINEFNVDDVVESASTTLQSRDKFNLIKFNCAHQ